jgi:hypothetical protein
MTYQDFKNEWNGRRIDYDHVYAYQCVDLILQYVKEGWGLATGVWGNAIDYWNKPTSVLLTKFDKISGTDCKQGDIVVLYGLSGNPYGHIGICESQTSTTVKLLEQNAMGGGDGLGRNAIGVYRDISKNRVAGILRPKATVVPPAPPAARSTVFLPSSVRSWRLYPIGGSLVPGTEKATLAPYQFPPGLTYKIEAWVGDYAVVITTQMFGRGVIWVKGTEAVIK